MNCYRRIIGFGAVSLAVCLGVLVALSGCGVSYADMGDNCPEGMSDVCCTCMYDEECDVRIVAICTDAGPPCEQEDGGAAAP